MNQNLVHVEFPNATLDCVEMRDHSAVVHIVTNGTTAEPRRFASKSDAVDYSFGMVPILRAVK